MAVEKSRQEQAIGVINEYLTAADICIKNERSGSGVVLGYPAALLLLCSVDAIGQGVLPKTQELTRLDVLADPLFDCVLTVDQARQIKNWYRHLLTHTGTMAVGVHLEPGGQDQPFMFNANGEPVVIYLGKLHEIVTRAWERVDKATFEPPPPERKPPALSVQVSSLSPVVSGMGLERA